MYENNHTLGKPHREYYIMHSEYIYIMCTYTQEVERGNTVELRYVQRASVLFI